MCYEPAAGGYGGCVEERDERLREMGRAQSWIPGLATTDSFTLI